MPAPADEAEIGVIVALPAEAAAWTDRRTDCRVRVAGLGSERARVAAVGTTGSGIRALLSFGVCGGLSPRLRPGDLLLPRHIVSPRGEWRTHDHWRARLLRALPVAHEVDALYCSEEPVTSTEDKSALASRGLAAVDMESAGVAQAAAQANVPFAVIKAVCDPASRTLPPLALRMLDARGRLRLFGLYEAVRAGPRAWRELRALRADFAAALASLRRAAPVLPPPLEGCAS